MGAKMKFEDLIRALSNRTGRPTEAKPRPALTLAASVKRLMSVYNIANQLALYRPYVWLKSGDSVDN